MVFRINLQLFSVILTFFFPYWDYSGEKAGCIFFFFFYSKRLLQVTPDLPEVHKLHRKK